MLCSEVLSTTSSSPLNLTMGHMGRGARGAGRGEERKVSSAMAKRDRASDSLTLPYARASRRSVLRHREGGGRKQRKKRIVFVR